ncbi:MAG: S-adenosylmethionine decarboxylase [Thermodesulfobacteriota bacterium]
MEQFPYSAFGPHLTLDGYGANPLALADLEVIYAFLEEAPDLIQMTKIMPPYVFKYQAPKPEDRGISGVILIAESHISIHTYPERAFLAADAFSCKDFDHLVLIDDLVRRFGIQRFEHNLFDRGLEWGKDIRVARRLLNRDRLLKAAGSEL